MLTLGYSIHFHQHFEVFFLSILTPHSLSCPPSFIHAEHLLLPQFWKAKPSSFKEVIFDIYKVYKHMSILETPFSLILDFSTLCSCGQELVLVLVDVKVRLFGSSSPLFTPIGNCTWMALPLLT